MKTSIFAAMLLTISPIAAQAVTYTIPGLIVSSEFQPAGGVSNMNQDGSGTSAYTSTVISSRTAAETAGIDSTHGTAFQNDNFFSLQTFEGFYTSGQPGYNRYEGNTYAVYTVTNDEPGEGEILYDFSVSDMTMTILNAYGPNVNPFTSPQDGSAGGRFLFEAFTAEGSGANGSLSVFRAEAEFWVYGNPMSGGASIEFGTVSGMSVANIQQIQSSGPGFTEGYSVTLGELSGSISLGNFAENESRLFQVQTTLIAIGSSYEHDIVATYQDPGTFNGFRRAVSAPVSTVPLPAAGWLLLVAVCGMGAARRSRRDAA